MKPTRTMIMGYLVVLMVTAPSCVMLSNPISDPYQATADTSLFGSWQAVADGGWADQLIVGTYRPTDGTGVNLPPELMHIERVKLDRDGKSKDSDVRLLCFPTRIADTRYLNVAVVTRENEQTLLRSGWNEASLFYAVFKYRVEGDKLYLQMMDLRRRPESRSPSKVKNFAHGLGRFVTLADSQNLVELLGSRRGERYFRDEVVFTRMKGQSQPLAATRPAGAL